MKIHEIVRDEKITPNLQFIVAQLIETRNRLLNTISKIPEEIIDKTPNSETIESIATLLDHIAAIEWSWIFEDIDGETMDEEEWKYAFATRSWSDVKQRTGKSIKYYIDRLEKVRTEVMTRLTIMDSEDRFRIVRQEENKYTIEWILYHLIHHESMHEGQISMINRLFAEKKQ